MADKKEHGPHPMALLRDWKLDLNPTIQKQAKTELEYYKLADLLTCLLLHSPTLNAGKIRFTAAQSQLAVLQGASDKTIYTRLKRLESMGAGPNQTLAIRHVEDALMHANNAILEDAEDTAEQSWVIYFDLEDSGSFVIQDGELFREEPGGTYTPVGRVRK